MSKPYWRDRFGFSLKNDLNDGLKERNVHIRDLHRYVTDYMLIFLEKHPPDHENPAECSPLWTPIPWLCHHLEISHSKLSKLFRELTGLNVIQTYDKLKLIETLIPLKYIQLIKEFLRSPSARLCQLETRNEKPETRFAGQGSKHFWTWLNAQRQNPDFDRQALAREFGFPSASRLHRAFYFAAELTPREFENLIIRQAIDAPAQFKRKRNEQNGLQPQQPEAPQETETVAPLTEQQYPIVLYNDPLPEPDDILDLILLALRRRQNRRRQHKLLCAPT